MPDSITIKQQKQQNTIHLLNIIHILTEMNKQILSLDNDIAYIKKWIAKHENDELKLNKSGWFY